MSAPILGRRAAPGRKAASPGVALGRRAALLGTAGTGLAAFAIGGRGAFAQSAPVTFGALPPLTGAGGPYGPAMLRAIQGVVEEANAAGGIRGRQIRIAFEDDQTNPDAGVRGARKLIDVDRVSALMGTWASAVTTAVAPLCWENRVPLFTVSGADSITQLPHQGHIFRTQPTSFLQITRAGDYLVAKGARRVFHLAAQSPFAQSSQEKLTERMRAGGGQVAGFIVYERDKTAFRSEVDQVMRSRADTIMLNGYLPDTTILLRELFRAGFDGRRFTFAYAANQRTLESLPAEVTNGLITFQPSPDIEGAGFKRLQARFGATEVDPYSAQTHDHATLAILAAAAAGDATGTAIREHVRRISQGDGEKVDNVTDGLKALAAGRSINFEGASGPCDFEANGDISGAKFRFEVAEAGRFKVLELSLITDWRDVLQLLLNGVMAGSVLMLPAIGFNCIFAVLRYPNFAIAGFCTLGAFAGWVANAQYGFPAPLALVVAFLVAGLAGLVAEEAALKPLRPSGPLTVAIASVAMTILLENIIRFGFGNDLRGYDLPVLRDWRFDGIRVNPQQLQNALSALVAAGLLFLLLGFTRLGRAMRAVADNPLLADIKGVDPDRIARIAVFIGAGLAGFGGMLIGLDTSIDPLTGFRVVLSVFAAAVVGGLGSIPGAALGALVVGVGEEMSLLLLEPSYRSVTAFLAILLVLTVRPQGLLGGRG